MPVIRHLDGYTKENAERILKFMKIAKAIEPSLELYETGRTQLVQAAYYARGRESYENVVSKYQIAGLPPPTKIENKQIVTWTMSSKHISWLAFDVVPCYQGRWFWDGTEVMKNKFRMIAEKAMKELNIKQPLPRDDQWHFELLSR